MFMKTNNWDRKFISQNDLIFEIVQINIQFIYILKT